MLCHVALHGHQTTWWEILSCHQHSVMECRQSEQASVVYSHGSSTEPQPLVRIGWNLQDTRHLAVLPARSCETLILDVRRPTRPLALKTHTAVVNAFDFAPHSAMHICTAGDDRQALIWDLGSGAGNIDLEPSLKYLAAAEVVALQWSALSPEHIAICYDTCAQILHV